MKIKETISKINFRNIFLFISWILVIFFFLYCSINAVHVKQEEVCKSVSFKIENGDDNYFIEVEDLNKELIEGKFNLVGRKITDINFKKVELNISKNEYLEKAMMYKSITGNIVIEVTPMNPILRVVANNGMNYYVSDQWKFVPISPKYTKKVILITGDITNIVHADNSRDSAFNMELKQLANFIVNNKFWTSMIDQIHIDQGNKIKLITSVLEPTIIFGQVDENMERKFKKIEVFLNKCLPIIQNNKYEALDITFKNQVLGIKKQTKNL